MGFFSGSKWDRVSSLASTCWMLLLIVGGIGVAVNWNLFTVAGGMLVVFAAGLGIIFIPGLLKQWHNKTDSVIDRKAHELAEKIKTTG